MTHGTTPAARIDLVPEQACPIAPVVDIVFSRWTTPILWALHEYGRHRFVELGRSLGPLFAALADWSANLGKVEQARQEYEAKEQLPRSRRS
ncbi:winged helix-turn-helix transcriptional regulator [Streptomyces sp. NPDC002623]